LEPDRQATEINRKKRPISLGDWITEKIPCADVDRMSFASVEISVSGVACLNAIRSKSVPNKNERRLRKSRNRCVSGFTKCPEK
jgi:hypothetical protein